MQSPRDMLIKLADELVTQNNRAFDLWTWLPSYRAAQVAHGDYASEHIPSLEDVLLEATVYIQHRCSPTSAQIKEVAHLYSCPCGEDHSGDPG
jgi:hypothetical protein